MDTQGIVEDIDTDDEDNLPKDVKSLTVLQRKARDNDIMYTDENGEPLSQKVLQEKLRTLGLLDVKKEVEKKEYINKNYVLHGAEWRTKYEKLQKKEKRTEGEEKELARLYSILSKIDEREAEKEEKREKLALRKAFHLEELQRYERLYQIDMNKALKTGDIREKLMVFSDESVDDNTYRNRFLHLLNSVNDEGLRKVIHEYVTHHNPLSMYSLLLLHKIIRNNGNLKFLDEKQRNLLPQKLEREIKLFKDLEESFMTTKEKADMERLAESLKPDASVLVKLKYKEELKETEREIEHLQNDRERRRDDDDDVSDLDQKLAILLKREKDLHMLLTQKASEESSHEIILRDMIEKLERELEREPDGKELIGSDDAKRIANLRFHYLEITKLFNVEQGRLTMEENAKYLQKMTRGATTKIKKINEQETELKKIQAIIETAISDADPTQYTEELREMVNDYRKAYPFGSNITDPDIKARTEQVNQQLRELAQWYRERLDSLSFDFSLVRIKAPLSEEEDDKRTPREIMEAKISMLKRQLEALRMYRLNLSTQKTKQIVLAPVKPNDRNRTEQIIQGIKQMLLEATSVSQQELDLIERLHIMDVPAYQKYKNLYHDAIKDTIAKDRVTVEYEELLARLHTLGGKLVSHKHELILETGPGADKEQIDLVFKKIQPLYEEVSERMAKYYQRIRDIEVELESKMVFDYARQYLETKKAKKSIDFYLPKVDKACPREFFKKPWITGYSGEFYVHLLDKLDHSLVDVSSVYTDSNPTRDVYYKGTHYLDVLLCTQPKTQEGNLLTITLPNKEKIGMMIKYRTDKKTFSRSLVTQDEKLFEKEEKWRKASGRMLEEEIRLIYDKPVSEFKDVLSKTIVTQLAGSGETTKKFFSHKNAEYIKNELMVKYADGTVGELLERLGQLVIFLDPKYMSREASLFNNRLKQGYISEKDILMFSVKDILKEVYDYIEATQDSRPTTLSLTMDKLVEQFPFLEKFKGVKGSFSLEQIIKNYNSMEETESDTDDEYDPFFDKYMNLLVLFRTLLRTDKSMDEEIIEYQLDKIHSFLKNNRHKTAYYHNKEKLSPFEVRQALEKNIRINIDNYVKKTIQKIIQALYIITKGKLKEVDRVFPSVFHTLDKSYCSNEIDASETDIVYYIEDHTVYCFSLSKLIKDKTYVNSYTHNLFSPEFIDFLTKHTKEQVVMEEEDPETRIRKQELLDEWIQMEERNIAELKIKRQEIEEIIDIVYNQLPDLKIKRVRKNILGRDMILSPNERLHLINTIIKSKNEIVKVYNDYKEDDGKNITERILKRREAYNTFLKENPKIMKQLYDAKDWDSLTESEREKLSKLKKKLIKKWGEHAVKEIENQVHSAYHLFKQSHSGMTMPELSEEWKKLSDDDKKELQEKAESIVPMPRRSDIIFNLQTVIATIIRKTIGSEIKRLDIGYRERLLEKVKENPEKTEVYWLDQDLLKKAVKHVVPSILPEFYDYMRVFEDKITDPEYREKFIETRDSLTESLYKD